MWLASIAEEHRCDPADVVLYALTEARARWPEGGPSDVGRPPAARW